MNCAGFATRCICNTFVVVRTHCTSFVPEMRKTSVAALGTDEMVTLEKATVPPRLPDHRSTRNFDSCVVRSAIYAVLVTGVHVVAPFVFTYMRVFNAPSDRIYSEPCAALTVGTFEP